MAAERRRGKQLEDALLQAAWDELAENGYAQFTIDAVAQRAGTSRPVLYRRWPDRHVLVRAAIAYAAARSPIATPDTGSLRGDVLDMMRQVNSTRRQLATVMSVHLSGYYQETGTSPADLRSTLAAGKHSVLDEVFTRAAHRGEVDPERVTPRMRRLPFDLLRQEFLMTFEPVPEEVLVEIVDILFLPLATGG
ncbi:TetR/AcrR family transcriptional regulator [Yinghuangia aomiensis]|uniref:TetR/AcrR family transcriptional regulator n=1 Tax=Yinghuangia aomiensis TaxID=676205 RepID=A0ABP9H452_9ACTN